MSSENINVSYIYYGHNAFPLVIPNPCVSFPPCQNTVQYILFSSPMTHLAHPSAYGTAVNPPRNFSCRVHPSITPTPCLIVFCIYFLVSTSSPVELPSPCMTTSPCVNGGTCVMRCEAPWYTCVCREGYTGQDCETELS